MKMNAHFRAQPFGNRVPYGRGHDRRKAVSIGSEEVNIRSCCPCLPLDRLKLNARPSQIKTHEHGTNLVMLKRVECRHEEIDQAPIAIA